MNEWKNERKIKKVLSRKVGDNGFVFRGDGLARLQGFDSATRFSAMFQESHCRFSS